MKFSPRTLSAAVATLAFFIAAPAFAASSVYQDLLEIGDLGYVAAGDSLSYQHFFAPATDPGIVISSIDSAVLQVAVVDDANCRRLRGCVTDWLFQPEIASIDLNGVEWQTGSATLNLFFGDITAEANLLANNGILNLTITSEVGDFVVLWSALDTAYTYERNSLGGAGSGGSGSPMPEPSAALVFALGALVVQRRVRRGVRAS